jgi:hypothetical protein
VLGDLDGDGKGDLVIARTSWSSSEASRDVRLTFRSTGTSFATARTQRTATQKAYDWFVGDLDGDGRADLSELRTAGSKNSPRLELTASPAAGVRFDASVPSTSADDSVDSVLGLADVDGDGKADVLSYHVPLDRKKWHYHGDLTIYAQRQTGGSGGTDQVGGRETLATVPLSGGPWDLEQVRAGDLNGDGRADLVIEESPTDYDPKGIRVRTTVLVSTADGFRAPQTSTFRVAEDYDLAGMLVGDVDGHGRDELVYVTHGNADVVRVARYTSKVTKPEPWGVVPDLSYGDLGLTDVNGDGRADVVAAGWKITAKDRSPREALVKVSLARPHDQLDEPRTWARVPRKFSNSASLDLISETELS